MDSPSNMAQEANPTTHDNKLDESRKYVLTNQSLLEDAEIALENLTHQEIQLTREAEELFKKQVVYVEQIDNLRDSVPNRETIDVDTKRLSALVDSSSSLVGEVCSKFRRIDLAKGRLEDCLAKIGDILDLKTCRNGMSKALGLNNYEEAAMHIKRYLSINQDELQKTLTIICGDQLGQYSSHSKQARMGKPLINLVESIAPNTPPDEIDKTIIDTKSMNEALSELDDARSKLLQLCQVNITRAIAEGDTKDIERFFKIFPMLNEHNDGLQRYAEYLQSKLLSQQVEDIMKSKEINQADKLAALYENIAKLVDAHQPLIETYYGPGHLIIVIRVIQKECDRLSRRILEEFRNETNLQYVANIVRSSSLHLANQSSLSNTQHNASLNLQPSKLDPRSVDKILNEISLIVSRSEVYLSFIVQRIQDDIKSKSECESERKAGSLELYNMIFLECELNHLIQEVGGIYVMLEQFYLNESSKKAIVMDQIDIDPSYPSCLISSMLDDIFFILKKCAKRAISTKSNEVFCAIINHCVTLLESKFCQVLEERLKNQQYYTSLSAKSLDFSQAYNALQSGRYLQSANDQEKSNAKYFSALNNLDKACDYMKTLRGILDVDVRKLKPTMLVNDQKHHDSQLEKSITCLNELTQLVGRFNSIINSSLYQLFNTSLRNRIRTEFKVVRDENPDLTSIVASNPVELTDLVRDLLKRSDSCLEESLLPENYSKLVSITKDFLASTLKTANK